MTPPIESAEPAVVIAVSGERRSWEIACRIAVLATSARREASFSAARSETRSRSTATSIRRPSDSATRSIALWSQSTSSVRYSQALPARVCNGTTISSGIAVGTGSMTIRARPAAVASATRSPIVSSWAPTLSVTRIAEATSATSLASRSRAAATSARLSASAARSRATAASRPTTTAAISRTISSIRSCEWAIASLWRGAMKK